MFNAGGNYNNGANAGVFYLNGGNNDRSNRNGNIGFRSALSHSVRCRKPKGLRSVPGLKGPVFAA